MIGGAVAAGISSEWIFWLNVPIGLAAIPLALARIEESLGGDTALDIGGLALVTGGALGIVWGLVRGNLSPTLLTSPVIGGTFGEGGL